MDVLVISACSGSKLHSAPIDRTTIDSSSLADLRERYPGSVASASEQYTGREHSNVKQAVNELRTHGQVDWYIISAGFGLIEGSTEIPAYDCTFSDIDSVRTRAERFGYDVDEQTNDETIQTVGQELGIPQDLTTLLEHGYNKVYIVLGRNYLLTVSEALENIPESTSAYAICPESSRELIGDCEWIPATEKEREELETTWMELRGRLFNQIIAN